MAQITGGSPANTGRRAPRSAQERRVDDASGRVSVQARLPLHVLTPWTGGGYDEARSWALAIANRVAAGAPELATVQIRKAQRGRRVYIDVLQNARGHHAVPPYVLRAVPGATISMPMTWTELTPDLPPAAFTTKSVIDRLAGRRRDPFAPLLRSFAGPRRTPAVS